MIGREEQLRCLTSLDRAGDTLDRSRDFRRVRDGGATCDSDSSLVPFPSSVSRRAFNLSILSLASRAYPEH